MHKNQVNRAIVAITNVLRDYGMTENAANDRARQIATVGLSGERVTAIIANEMLTPTAVIKGISESRLRFKASIEVARHWIACTSTSAFSQWMRLHTQLGMTRKKSAEWLNNNGYVGTKMKECLETSGYRDAKYHGGTLQHCISKLEKSVQQMREPS